MRLAVVAPLVTPLRPAQLGGSQAFAADLALELGRRGHDACLVCAEGSEVPGARLLEVPVSAGAEAALVRPGGTAEPAPSPVLEAAFTAAYERARRAGAQVISQHGFDAEATAQPRGLPTLHTLHLPPLSARMIDAVRRSGDAFVTVSNACAAAWSAAGVPSLPVLRNGVSSFEVPRGPVEPIALVAGRISPEKGTDTAIRVARRAGLEPVLAGAVYDRAYFEDRVVLLGARWLGAVARPDLWRLLATATVAVLAIDWEEPFGLVAAEAQMAGCPVAAFRRGAMPEVVEEGVSGCLAPPGDESALVAAVKSAARLDRDAVRASARRRLSIAAAAPGYERALAALA